MRQEGNPTCQLVCGPQRTSFAVMLTAAAVCLRCCSLCCHELHLAMQSCRLLRQHALVLRSAGHTLASMDTALPRPTQCAAFGVQHTTLLHECCHCCCAIPCAGAAVACMAGNMQNFKVSAYLLHSLNCKCFCMRLCACTLSMRALRACSWATGTVCRPSYAHGHQATQHEAVEVNMLLVTSLLTCPGSMLLADLRNSCCLDCCCCLNCLCILLC